MTNCRSLAVALESFDENDSLAGTQVLLVRRLPRYIVAKAVSVFCDVCKQESISCDNRGTGTHMGGNSRHVRPP